MTDHILYESFLVGVGTTSNPRFIGQDIVELLGGFAKVHDTLVECGNNWDEFDKVVERYKKLKAFA